MYTIVAIYSYSILEPAFNDDYDKMDDVVYNMYALTIEKYLLKYFL